MTPFHHIFYGFNDALFDWHEGESEFPFDFRVVTAHCTANIYADIHAGISWLGEGERLHEQ